MFSKINLVYDISLCVKTKIIHSEALTPAWQNASSSLFE